MERWPRVSIVTPTFNQGQYIVETIESVAAQDYPNLEHIVIDGGSTDGRLKALTRYSHLRVISEPDRGQADAINKGFRMATGEVWGFLNSDDTLLPGALLRVVQEIDPEHGRQIVMGRCRFIDRDSHFTGIEHPSHFESHRRVLEIWKGHMIPQPAVFWTPEVWNTCGPMDETLKYHLDYDLFCRFSRRYRFHVVDQVFATYRLHGESKTERWTEVERLEDSMRLSRRYWGSPLTPTYWQLTLSLAMYRFNRVGRGRSWLQQARQAWYHREMMRVALRAFPGAMLAPEVVFYMVIYPILREHAQGIAKKALTRLGKMDEVAPQSSVYFDRTEPWGDGWVGPRLVLSCEAGPAARTLCIRGWVDLTYVMRPFLLKVYVDGEDTGEQCIERSGDFTLQLLLPNPLLSGLEVWRRASLSWIRGLYVKLSVVIPCYNERHTIREVIRRVQGTPFDKEIIVVDDGSTDGTREVLESLTYENLLALYQDRNQGKGAALRRGFAHAAGDVVLVQDADLEYDPADYPRLVQPILDGMADVVYGSRFQGSPRRILLFSHTLANWLLTLLSNMTTNLNLTDMETGYKVFRHEVIQSIHIDSNRFGFEPEITAKIARRGYRIYEVPIAYRGRTYDEGKKITWKDGVLALGQILKYGLISDLGDGHRTLERMDNLTRYCRWLWQVIEPDVGKRVLELGSGTGGLTRYLASRPFLVASDIEPAYLRTLRERFHCWEGVGVCELDLDREQWTGLPGAPFDTVVASNVLEHIKDDLRVLRNAYAVLQSGGRMVVIVPAGPRLFGQIDAAIGHYRRYSRAELGDKLTAAGFTVVRCRPLNALAMAGWFLNSRLLGRRRVPMLQGRLFDLLVPLQRRLEGWCRPPIGLSLVAVGRKP